MSDRVIEAFATEALAGATTPAPAPTDIIFEGTLDEVQEHFQEKLWTEGLPIVPPTIDRVESFLRFTDRSPDEVIGPLLPENREATVWNVAVNGVMAGCRPEYMPVLVAIVEAIADPEFRIMDGGSTPRVGATGDPERADHQATGVPLRLGQHARWDTGQYKRGPIPEAVHAQCGWAASDG